MLPSIAVIGTVFVDYKGFANANYQALGRNVGRVEVVPGGVARNVAVNMKHLALDTWFVGTLNFDGAGELLRSKMEDYGIKLDYLKLVPAGGTGVWLAILDHKGDLQGSISQMPDVEVMEDAIIPALPEIMPKVQGIAIEIDLSEKIARNIFARSRQTGSKVYSLPGNFSVIGKHYDFFKEMECFICNETEAAQLFGQEIDDAEKILAEAVAFAKEYKLKNFVVTLGEKGSVYVSQDGMTGFQDVYKTNVVDSTGAGDAFFSATVAALMHGRTLASAVDAGAKVASLVISAKESDCAELGERIAKEIKLDWFK